MDNLRLLVLCFYCVCVFFVSCASIRFDDSKQFSLLPYLLSFLFLFLFYIRHYGNFWDEFLY